MALEAGQHLVIYDGVCRFCNGAVLFIIARDPAEKFVFTPMQSMLARRMIEEHCPRQSSIDTFVLIKNGKAYLWSDAALEICRDLTGYWRWFNVLRVLPASLRNWCYQQLARQRYRLFGRFDRCSLPQSGLKHRFIDLDGVC